MRGALAFVIVVGFVVYPNAQGEVSDAELEAASGGRVVRVGALSRNGQVSSVALEVYVARVLAGEGEPRAAEAAQQALAIAVRTYVLAHLDEHGDEGFDVCDTTHCQVPRAATAASRRATSATAGRVLSWRGEVASIFYSASCGGRSEIASQVWHGPDYPYLRSAVDDVHEHDEPWRAELSLGDVQQRLERIGFDGRLRDLKVDARNGSGRVSRLRLVGLRPEAIAGNEFRLAVGATQVRSTAFSLKRRGTMLEFTGRGYGHGVGMCVIGAGRRAARGEGVEEILARYYPGLDLTRLNGLARGATPGLVIPRAPSAPPPAVMPGGAIAVLVPAASLVAQADLERLAARAHDDLSRTLGTSVAPITIRLHDTIESFRLVTGRPWWVSARAEGTRIDLAPAAILAQREGLEGATRVAVAELLVASTLADRPVWVRVGAGRYFARPAPIPPAGPRVRCPSDAELTLAISVTAQREAESRAEACFARELVKTRDWRSVR